MTTDVTDTAYILDEQIGYLLRLASQRHTLIFQELIPLGLTPMQFSTLIRVHEHGEVSQNHLGRLAAMDIATIKGVVDRLRDKDLLASRPDKADRRRSIISLTAAGKAMIHELHAKGHKITSKTLEPLATEDRERLVQLVKKLV